MKKMYTGRRKSVFLIACFSFLLLILVQVVWLHYTYEFKKKEFKEKVSYSLRFFYNDFQNSKVLQGKMNEIWNDRGSLEEVQQHIRFSVDTFFTKQNIPTSYVFGIGQSREKISRFSMLNENIFWASDSAFQKQINESEFKLLGFNKNEEGYLHVNFFFPKEHLFILSELTPLLALSVFTFLILGFCLINLAATIKHQQKLSRMKNDFINNMTHELKTPVFTISIASKILEEHEVIRDSDKLRTYVSTVQQETARLNSLIEKVLQAASLEKSHVKLQKKKLDLHSLIQDAVKSFELIREQRNGKIEMQLDAKSTYIEADEEHLVNMIFNLLDNAFKYTKNIPEIIVATRNEGNRLYLSVKDNGMGIDEDTKQFIFERFFRADTGDVHDVKGYGIGLSYVKSVIKAHKGDITIKSRIGAGSEFILYIPQVE